jgi:aminomethyltransferase
MEERPIGMAEPQATTALRRTPLNDLHVRLGARMVPFAGYEMPVQYPAGIIKEHLHTRAAAGLFDVSHMGQIALRASSGRAADVARTLEALVPGDLIGLAVGRQRYTLFTNAAGGALDDLMVANLGDRLMLVVNAGRKAFDEAHLRAQLGGDCMIEPLLERALIALQGPAAEAVLAAFTSDVSAMRFMDVRTIKLAGEACIVSRSGYTGEDGFEISVPAPAAQSLFEALLKDARVMPVGLGARDSLRLEAGLCLYGADLDETITPVEASLDWTIPPVRRAGGARANGFPGAETILQQLARGPARRRVGLKPQGRTPVRGGASLFASERDAAPLGVVSSGGFGVSLDAPIAMGYVPSAVAASGTPLFTEVRGRRLAVAVAPLPFVANHYKRR